jgi:peptide chain release factor 3
VHKTQNTTPQQVVQYRMKDEYGVDTTLEPLGFSMARWVIGGWPAVEKAGRMFNTSVVKDGYGRPVLLFRNEFAFQQVVAEQGEALGELSPYALPPDS